MEYALTEQDHERLKAIHARTDEIDREIEAVFEEMAPFERRLSELRGERDRLNDGFRAFLRTRRVETPSLETTP